jgi:GNAT superfamily N-acetyltransferase
MVSFHIEVEPAPKDLRVLEDGLYAYNVEQTGSDDGKWLSIFVRDDCGEIVAGLHGWTWCGACKVERLWVRQDLRRQGYGQRLLAAVEQEAGQGCDQICSTRSASRRRSSTGIWATRSLASWKASPGTHTRSTT